jgi:hypothetical protein
MSSENKTETKNLNAIISQKSKLKNQIKFKDEKIQNLETYDDIYISNMKNKLIELSPEKLIDHILKESKYQSENQGKKFNDKDEFLEELKITAIANFIESIKHKNSKEIEQEFKKKLEEYNLATKLYRDKKDKELTECINALDLNKIKIKDLEISKANLNERNKKLEQDKKEKEDTIFKLQTKFVIFEKLKPTFEEFFKEYPDEDPKKIIEDIKQKRDDAVRIMEEVNELREKIYKLKKEKQEINDKNRKNLHELSEKLSQAELNNKDRTEKYLDEIRILNLELANSKVYKEEIFKMQKMLYHIYNKLVTRLALDKDIQLNPSLNVQEKDFRPELFDSTELAKYLEGMLTNSHDNWSSKMLRETIAYANMMNRIYFKENVNMRYDPVAVFRKIKEKFEEFQRQANIDQKENEKYKDKITKLEMEIKKFKREIKNKEIQYENLEKRFEDQFTKKLLNSKNLRTSQRQKSRKSRKLSSDNENQDSSGYKNTSKSKNNNKQDFNNINNNEENSDLSDNSIGETVYHKSQGVNLNNVKDGKDVKDLNKVKRARSAVSFKLNIQDKSKIVYI